ncbi:Anp1-domain-containing protein [Leucosporidium creatinivorum]|uniref:Anp1-domain-containing protein n=1 Tax=Leucosporidium creatinivorum TaxID=106004 RepID=A0A1Y2G6E4_9BASI|nr:Anp1-domain-containing protein [Leucosporidium creatinivorum]
MGNGWSDFWAAKPTDYLPLPLRRESIPDSPDLRQLSWQHKRRTLLGYLLATVLCAFAAVGAVSSTLALSGQIKLVPHYSKAQLLDAGWLRPPLALEEWSPSSITDDERPLARLSTHDFTLPPTTSTTSLNLLILTPLHNAADRLPNLFSKLDAFTHPRINTSLGFIVSDSTDDTGDVLREMVDQRRENYREVTLLHKDFNIENPGGKSRHQLWAQGQRRTVLAKARTTLLMSTLRADVDWVLWLDSDVWEVSSSLFEDLLLYGNTGVTRAGPEELVDADEVWSDVVAANVFTRKKDGSLQAYDLNNWAENSDSLRRQNELTDDTLLVEGNKKLDMHRDRLVTLHTPPNNVTGPIPPASSFPWLREENWEENDMYDPESPAYVGQRVEIDGVGGVATLVRADAHRLGAVFPSWLERHELETEGFGVMAKKVGAKVVGLPNYVVIHGECSSCSLASSLADPFSLLPANNG